MQVATDYTDEHKLNARQKISDNLWQKNETWVPSALYLLFPFNQPEVYAKDAHQRKQLHEKIGEVRNGDDGPWQYLGKELISDWPI